jgi:DNA modification methylase
MVEAYSHEASSCGFWPGGAPVNEPVFYAYAYPEPQGFKDYPIQPSEAFYHKEMREFVLPYDVVRTTNSPDEVLLSFLQSTYEAAATCANWDRRALER